MARHRGGVDRGLQIQRRDRHAEIDAGAAFDGAVHDLSAEPAQGGSALVLPPDQGAHLVAFGEQHSGEVAADGADGAGRSGHEDRAVLCGFHHHIAGSRVVRRKKILAAFGVPSGRSQGVDGSFLGILWPGSGKSAPIPDIHAKGNAYATGSHY